MMKINIARLAAVGAAALVLGVGAVAMAQPGPGAGRHGPGPGMEMGMGIEHVLAGLQSQLSLNTSQQVQWDAAVAKAKEARTAAHANMQTLHDALATELANTTPNLAKVAAVADQVRTSNQTLRQGVRDQWLKLYGMLSQEQVTVVRAALQAQLARMDSFHAKMLERMQRQGG